MIKLEIKNYILNNCNKVKINSQDIIKGDIFIALLGKNTHGCNYIDEALKNGANYIITDYVLDDNHLNKKIIIIPNVLNLLLYIAKEKRRLFKGKVIGVTGSIGKTSVKENLKFFLKESFKVSVSIKSYNNFLGVLISMLNLGIEDDYGIFELGTNDFFEIRNLVTILQPNQVIITNIYPSHLEKLINTRNIAKEKSDIFNPNYNSNVELAILCNNNEDEKFIVQQALKLNCFEIITYSSDNSSDIKIKSIESFDEFHSKICIEYNDKKISLVVNKNQISRINNILICLGIFIYNKINIEKFKILLKNLPLLEGRGLQKNIVINKKEIILIDESYNASPQSMKTTIDYFSSLKIGKKQKKFLILGEMKELGEDTIKYHRNLLYQLYKTNINNIILCGELMQIALDKNMNSRFTIILNIDLIIGYLKNNISNNDIILIKGSNSSITNQLTRRLLKKQED